MSKITTEMIKEIRGRTDAGILDCKKALEETGCDIDEALELLAKRGAKIKRSPKKIAEMSELYDKSDEFINTVNKINTARKELEKYEIPELPLKLEKYYKNISDEINISIGEFTIYPKKNINLCMEGYRFILDNDNKWKDMAIENQWNKNWIIIAINNSDPIIADLNFENIPVRYDFHGSGRDWDFKCLFDEIGNFWKFIKVLIEMSEKNNCKNNLNEYINKNYDNFIGLLDKEFTEEEIKNIVFF